MTRAELCALARWVQSMPYEWPSPPAATSARASGKGSCASKHALLAEDLAAIGIASAPLLVVGPLVPAVLASEPELAEGRDLVEVHECLVVIGDAGAPLRVDVTWDPPLAARGLPATVDWDGASDMVLAVDAVGPGWSVPRDRLREAKEALRTRIYRPGQRALRDRILGALSTRFASWRGGAA